MKTIISLKKLSLIILGLFLIVLPQAAHALSLQIPLGSRREVADLAEYIQIFYQYFVGIIGIIAVVMIMYGGLRWLSSGGNAEKINKAKDQMFSAVIGLVIILTSYVFLATINPELVKLKVPFVGGVNISGVSVGAEDKSLCQDKEVPCGAIRVSGATNGQDRHCIGTKCDANDTVCRLTEDAMGTSFIGGGCVTASQIVLENTETRQRIDVRAIHGGLECGSYQEYIGTSVSRLGKDCPSSYNKNCFFEGLVGLLNPEQTITSLTCPGD